MPDDSTPILQQAQTAPAGDGGIVVRTFRQILVWPLQLIPLKEGCQIQRHWEWLGEDGCPWSPVTDEFPENPSEFKERHYIEFSAFLPYVQRFLYGEGATGDRRSGYGASPIRVFRRHDVARARVLLGNGRPSFEVDVVHIDLYFFYDIDVAILAVELHAEDLPLCQVQDALFRLGRTYPSSWNADGTAAHCPERVDWLAADGTVLATSDYEKRETYLEFVCRQRTPWTASHWAFILQPLVLHLSPDIGPIRYRQMEHQRMPVMAFLAVDDPAALARSDWVRLGMAAGSGEEGRLPFADGFLRDFEARYCYDRFWGSESTAEWTTTRMVCTTRAFIMVGSHHEPAFADAETGILGQFRHQYFLLGLIAHFHRAALLMLSDRLVMAISHLDISDVETIRLFKRDIRQILEIFLRFTHRYWFHEVSTQTPARDLFRLWSEHLGTERLFREVRDEVQDMSDYLDSDGLRRQANSVLRLTVVTIVGMVGTLVTGFFGMNLLALGDEPLGWRIGVFLLGTVATVGLILFTLLKSKRMADFFESVSDERLSRRKKIQLFWQVWRRQG
jgi:hypothetical protein